MQPIRRDSELPPAVPWAESLGAEQAQESQAWAPAHAWAARSPEPFGQPPQHPGRVLSLVRRDLGFGRCTSYHCTCALTGGARRRVCAGQSRVGIPGSRFHRNVEAFVPRVYAPFCPFQMAETVKGSGMPETHPAFLLQLWGKRYTPWLKLGTPPLPLLEILTLLGGGSPSWEAGGLLHSSTCQDSDELNFRQRMVFKCSQCHAQG